MTTDGDGNRGSRTAGGVTTRFPVDDLTPTGYAQVAEELVSGAVAVRYTHGIQRISQSRPSGTHFYGYDGGGSVRQLTDASGAVTDSYTYDAFGVLIGGTGSTVNVYRYRGEQWDASVGMYYLRARWYEPTEGRFWTADKLEAVGNTSTSLNAYLFAGADPVNYVDPTGYSPVMETSLPVGLIDAPIAARFLIPIRTFPIIEGYGALGTVKVTTAGMFVLCILKTVGDAAFKSVGIVDPYFDMPVGGFEYGCRIPLPVASSDNPDEPGEPDNPDRRIPKPDKPKRGCCCTCRTDADDTMPGNTRPGLPRFAFGTATKANCPAAAKEAKRRATHNLGMKPKHIGCRCSGK